jgi:2-isopropylmalate synthase
MTTAIASKYRPFPQIPIKNREWPDRILTEAPTWCSVDLRDGNQALAAPMNVEQKLEMFLMLVAAGFKEIEVGFPSASNVEFNFIRRLIEEKLIPDDVTIQVLVQCREDLIKRTIDSLIGAKKVIVHFYNSTSPAQRKLVFKKTEDEVVALAVQGARWIKENLHKLEKTDVRIEYSPESFSATEIDFSVRICAAVMAEFQPTVERPLILNLPNTVEVAMPNMYADQVEYFIREMANFFPRGSFVVSIHTHNDRGTGIASTEQGMLAGAQRVEGTLFGNGERSGNADLIIVACNLMMHGIDPTLNLKDLSVLQDVYERCTGLTVHERHPWSGSLVFSAFSGSHQDAIKKGDEAWRAQGEQGEWCVPYMPLDPQDLGRSMETIRINSQSGKGGVAFVLKQQFGIQLPSALQREFGAVFNELANGKGEIKADQLRYWLYEEFMRRPGPYVLEHVEFNERPQRPTICRATIQVNGTTQNLSGKGAGTLGAFMNALTDRGLIPAETGLDIAEMDVHNLKAAAAGVDAEAFAWVQIKFREGLVYGVGVHQNTTKAPVYAIIAALNRALSSEKEE